MFWIYGSYRHIKVMVFLGQHDMGEILELMLLHFVENPGESRPSLAMNDSKNRSIGKVQEADMLKLNMLESDWD